MKKQTLIAFAVLLTLTVIGFGFFNWNTTEIELVVNKENNIEPVSNQNMTTIEFNEFTDFIYGIGPRFSPIKKSDINKMSSINDFLEEDVIRNIATIKSTSVILVIGDEQSDIRAYGESTEFTTSQLQLLQSSDYSTNFVMRVEYEERDPVSGNLFENYRSPHHTIVPEQQASYSEGEDALKLYLKESCQTVLIGVNPEKLKPAKLYFTVTENGTIKDIKLDRDSGYPEVDKKMIELMNQLPGTWSSAKNSKGEPVNQELVVSFGLMGC